MASGEEKKTRPKRIKAWFQDGKHWLQFGVGWNLFPLILAAFIFLQGRSKKPFVTAAGTYSMAIFSITSSAIGNAVALSKNSKVDKTKVSHGFMDFARLLSAIIYIMFFSEFASHAVVLGYDISLWVQVFCLVVLSLLLLYAINFGVKLERESKRLELLDTIAKQEELSQKQPEGSTKISGKGKKGGRKNQNGCFRKEK